MDYIPAKTIISNYVKEIMRIFKIYLYKLVLLYYNKAKKNLILPANPNSLI